MRHKYTDRFESFWELFIHTTPDEPGPKRNAFKTWQEEQLEDVWEDVCKGVLTHARNNKHLKSKGRFVATWKHGQGWLRGDWEQADMAEMERIKAVHARQNQLHAKRDKDRQQYKEVFKGWDTKQYADYSKTYGNSLDWLWEEVQREAEGVC